MVNYDYKQSGINKKPSPNSVELFAKFRLYLLTEQLGGGELLAAQDKSGLCDMLNVVVLLRWRWWWWWCGGAQ